MRRYSLTTCIATALTTIVSNLRVELA